MPHFRWKLSVCVALISETFFWLVEIETPSRKAPFIVCRMVTSASTAASDLLMHSSGPFGTRVAFWVEVPLVEPFRSVSSFPASVVRPMQFRDLGERRPQQKPFVWKSETLRGREKLLSGCIAIQYGVWVKIVRVENGTIFTNMYISLGIQKDFIYEIERFYKLHFFCRKKKQNLLT